MPRLSTALLSHARRIDPFLPLLLRSCRDLPSVVNELRWIREHVETVALARKQNRLDRQWISFLRSLCMQRSRGKPLQYILGTQPFGDLEILCRAGVLIPRQETELYTTQIGQLIIEKFRQKDAKFRILDLCSGSGCISLLLYALISKQIPSLEIFGIDISQKAVDLARQNLSHNISNGNISCKANEQIRFMRGDIFEDMGFSKTSYDVVISNPPYISPCGYDQRTARSVRNYEPKIALVPSTCHSNLDLSQDLDKRDTSIGDKFYPRVLEIAHKCNAKAVLTEVADLEQARRIATLVLKGGTWTDCEIWRDYPHSGIVSETMVHGMSVRTRGEGNGRSVLAWNASLNMTRCGS